MAFKTDIDGQIIRRDEEDNRGQGNPHEIWYRFNGRQLGYTGNNGTENLTEAASIEDRKVIAPSTPGAFRNGQLAGSSYADFAQSYDPLNSYAQGSGAGSYTVHGGESLQAIAQNLWGDAGLWYKLAEANGLTASSALTEGMTLRLPAGVVRTTHNANTLTPYDPAEAIGDVSPTSPQPNKPKKNKCGVFGQILVLAVSIAVTAIVSTIPVVGPIIGPAVGNLAGQAFGQVTGIQQGGINWKSVGSTFLRTLLPQGGVLTEIATQGIEQAIGLRDKFDWGGVAASGVLAALQVAGSPFGAARSVGAQVAQTIAINAAYTLADAATRSAVNGTSFGDNIRAALPGALVHTAMDIGRDAAAGRLSSGYYKKPEAGASGSGGGGGGGSTFGSGKTVGQRFEAMLPDVTSTASFRQVAYNVTPSGSSDSYGALTGPAFAAIKALLNMPGPDDIVVTARREPVTEAEHSWGWKLADAIGAHEGGFLYNIVQGRNIDGSVNSNYLARGQAESAVARNLSRSMDRLNRSAVDTKLSPRFYYVKNPPMSFFDVQMGPPQVAVGQVNAKGAALGAIELASVLPAGRAGKVVRYGAAETKLAGDLAPVFYRANPAELRFSQSTASPNFSKGGTINDLVADLKNGLLPEQVGGGPLQVVMRDGVPFSMDNRRLVAFNAAGVKDIPIEVVSLKNPRVAERFAERFDPVAGQGKMIVIVPNSGKTAAQQLLYDNGLIRRMP